MNATSTSLCSEGFQVSVPVLLFGAFAFLLIGAFATLGNIIATVALSTSNFRHLGTTVLIMNLGISILPICASTLPFISILCFEKALSDHIDSLGKDTAMKGFYILTTICNQVELHTITTLAINRAFAIASPTYYKAHFNKPSTIWATVVLIWGYSILLWIPVSVGAWGYLEVHTKAFFIEVQDESTAKLVTLISVCYVLPFLVTVGCHWIIFTRFNKNNSNRESSRITRPWQNHVTRTVTYIFLLQWIFSVPHFVAHFLKRRDCWPHLWLFIHILYFSRFCINPFVYIYSSRRYKRDFIRVIAIFKQSICALPESNNATTVSLQHAYTTPRLSRGDEAYV